MRKHIILIVFIGTLSSLFGQANGGQFTLNQAKDYALSNHLAIKNTELDIASAKQRSREVTAMGLPQISFSGSFQNFINLPTQVVDASFINPNAAEGETIQFRAGTTYSANGTLQANQLLFNGSYIVGLQVAKFFVEFSESSNTQSQEEVLFNVTQAYQIAAVGKQNLAFVDSMVLVTTKLIEEQKVYLELGLLDQESIDQLEFSLLQAKNSKTSAEIQYNNSLNLLKMTMGYPIGDPIEIAETASELMARQSLKDKTNSNLQNNLTLQLLNKQKTLSEYNLKNYKYGQLPTLAAFFNHQYNAYRNEFNFFADKPWFPQTFWGLQLNVPIFSGGEKYAQIQQAKIRIMKDENQIKLYEQTLKMQEVQYQNNLLSATQQLELQEKNIELANKIYSNAIAKRDIGKINSLEVTQKYNQVIIAQSQYVGSLIDVLNSKLNIDKLYNQLLK